MTCSGCFCKYVKSNNRIIDTRLSLNHARYTEAPFTHILYG